MRPFTERGFRKAIERSLRRLKYNDVGLDDVERLNDRAVEIARLATLTDDEAKGHANELRRGFTGPPTRTLLTNVAALPYSMMPFYSYQVSPNSDAVRSIVEFADRVSTDYDVAVAVELARRSVDEQRSTHPRAAQLLSALNLHEKSGGAWRKVWQSVPFWQGRRVDYSDYQKDHWIPPTVKQTDVHEFVDRAARAYVEGLTAVANDVANNDLRSRLDARSPHYGVMKMLVDRVIDPRALDPVEELPRTWSGNLDHDFVAMEEIVEMCKATGDARFISLVRDVLQEHSTVYDSNAHQRKGAFIPIIKPKTDISGIEGILDPESSFDQRLGAVVDELRSRGLLEAADMAERALDEVHAAGIVNIEADELQQEREIARRGAEEAAVIQWRANLDQYAEGVVAQAKGVQPMAGFHQVRRSVMAGLRADVAAGGYDDKTGLADRLALTTDQDRVWARGTEAVMSSVASYVAFKSRLSQVWPMGANLPDDVLLDRANDEVTRALGPVAALRDVYLSNVERAQHALDEYLPRPAPAVEQDVPETNPAAGQNAHDPVLQDVSAQEPDVPKRADMPVTELSTVDSSSDAHSGPAKAEASAAPETHRVGQHRLVVDDETNTDVSPGGGRRRPSPHPRRRSGHVGELAPPTTGGRHAASDAPSILGASGESARPVFEVEGGLSGLSTHDPSHDHSTPEVGDGGVDNTMPF